MLPHCVTEIYTSNGGLRSVPSDLMNIVRSVGINWEVKMYVLHAYGGTHSSYFQPVGGEEKAGIIVQGVLS